MAFWFTNKVVWFVLAAMLEGILLSSNMAAKTTCYLYLDKCLIVTLRCAVNVTTSSFQHFSWSCKICVQKEVIHNCKNHILVNFRRLLQSLNFWDVQLIRKSITWSTHAKGRTLRGSLFPFSTRKKKKKQTNKKHKLIKNPWSQVRLSRPHCKLSLWAYQQFLFSVYFNVLFFHI